PVPAPVPIPVTGACGAGVAILAPFGAAASVQAGRRRNQP
ncbi:hypothetical protein I3V73_20005, partial [Stenotrophomonas sp. 232]|nr:hypothetical protein [Stenotrophomonas sp. 232]